MGLIKNRIVLHFPGFEPLNSHSHHARYRRSAAQSASTWELNLEVGELCNEGSAVHFDVACQADNVLTESRIYIFDHFTLVSSLTDNPVWRRILTGYASAVSVVREGGMMRYFFHAWRFGLFFFFPFLLMAIGTAAGLVVAALPVLLRIDIGNFLWSLPLALMLLRYVILPLLTRFLTLHLFADWELAVAIARLDRPEVNDWLETCATDIRRALEDDAEEYVISSHSIGSAIAAHVIGAILAKDPDIFKGKRVVFATLGSAILQCSLMHSAFTLRAHVGLIARTPEIFWLDVQCLTDSIHFYKSRVVSLAGHVDANQATIAFIRIKRLVSAERYRRIKRDFLRVHRQYVLGSDNRSNFDFTLMTAGPISSDAFQASRHN